jgi:hypothetical protein
MCNTPSVNRSHTSYPPACEDWTGCSDTLAFNLYEPCVLYIGRAPRYPLNTPFYVFFQQIYVLNFFKYVAHSPFFLYKMPLFHNATLFDSCIIRILHTGCAKN